MPQVGKGKQSVPVVLEDYQVDYLEMLSGLGTNLGPTVTAICQNILRIEIQRMINTDHHKKDWR
jgi:hypothetical protein